MLNNKESIRCFFTSFAYKLKEEIVEELTDFVQVMYIKHRIFF